MRARYLGLIAAPLLMAQCAPACVPGRATCAAGDDAAANPDAAPVDRYDCAADDATGSVDDHDDVDPVDVDVFQHHNDVSTHDNYDTGLDDVHRCRCRSESHRRWPGRSPHP